MFLARENLPSRALPGLLPSQHTLDKGVTHTRKTSRSQSPADRHYAIITACLNPTAVRRLPRCDIWYGNPGVTTCALPIMQKSLSAPWRRRKAILRYISRTQDLRHRGTSRLSIVDCRLTIAAQGSLRGCSLCASGSLWRPSLSLLRENDGIRHRGAEKQREQRKRLRPQISQIMRIQEGIERQKQRKSAKSVKSADRAVVVV